MVRRRFVPSSVSKCRFVRFIQTKFRCEPARQEEWTEAKGDNINQEFEKALDIALLVRKQNPNFPGNEAWIQQLENILNR